MTSSTDYELTHMEKCISKFMVMMTLYPLNYNIGHTSRGPYNIPI